MIYILFLIGLVVGSFLEALTYRLPRGESVLRGRSKCPKCKKTIRWHDNIPLISFALLSGKCRDCGEKISTRCPLIEISTAVIFVFIWQFYTGRLPLPLVFVVSSLMIAIFVIDLEHRIIPDSLTFLGLGVVLILFLVTDIPLLYIYLASGAGAALFLLLLNLVTQGRGMGLGDVKLALFSGLVLGYPVVILWILIAFIAGALVGIILIAMGRAKLKQKIAFGPFLVFSFLISLMFGEYISFLLFPYL